MHVAICGGGVIGAACAYELSRRGVAVTLIERWRVAGCASGKSGGFLARDWCRGTSVDALAQRSFDLHATWAEALGNPYGYRRVDTFSAVLSARRKLRAAGDPGLAPWLADEATHRSHLGTPATTAQLDPAAFTQALVDAAVARGGKLEIATIVGLARSRDAARVTGVRLEGGREIAADAVIIAMGPWSLLASRWLPLPAIHGLKGHSVVFRPEAAFPAETIFAEFEERGGDVLSPEIVPRVDGTLYVCGLPGRDPLPIDPSKVQPETGGCARLREATIRLVPSLAGATVIAEQACHRPITEDGVPLIGGVPGADGAYVATGHSVWGMLNAPGTAEAIAELIIDGRTSNVDLSPFAADRLEPLDPAQLDIRAG